MNNEEKYLSVLEFLKPFAEGSDGFVGFTKADRSQQDEESNKRWGTFNNWYGECAGGEVDLPYELIEDDSVEYYFTPAVLTEQSRLQVKFQHSNVIWIDFDEPVDWQTFDPAPSIVVQTSRDKVHCYWLLDWRIVNFNDQRYWCKRFLEFFGNGDKSGFDATQLLKLPWGKNLKLGAQNTDGSPFEPKIIKFEPELRYPEVSFEHIPEPAVALVNAVDMSAVPDVPESQGGWQYYLDMHRSAIPQALEEKIRTYNEGGEEKRSGVLFNLIGELFEKLENPEEVFLCLLGSPNDKFSADHGARGSLLLWKDVNRVAVKVQKAKTVPKVAKGLALILDNNELPAAKKVVEGTAYVMEALRGTGDFVQTTRGEGYFIDKRAEAVTLHQVSVLRTSPFAGTLRRRFGLNEGAHKSVITGILHETIDECQAETPIKFHHFAHYDEERNRVYVDRYDGYMYVLDGEKIHLHPHGHDKVYFYQNGNSEFPRTFEYTSEYESGGLDSIILDGPNYTTQGLGIDRIQLRHLLKTWVSSFFFPSRMNTKPIVLIYGAADSGKTTLFQNLSIMFTGDSTYSVTEIPTDTKEFNVQVTQSSYIFYDNVEVNKKEMQVKLAQVATGYTVKNRVLFTNNEMLSEKARCFVGITSRTLDKIQDDVASRYILIPVQSFDNRATGTRQRRSMSDILKEVTTKRDVLWSELLDFVNKMVKEIDEHGWPESGSEMRMADYADLLDITCSIAGQSPRLIEKFILNMQSEIVSENDPVFDAFKALMLQDDFDPAKKYSGKALYDTLNGISRKVSMAYRTSNKFSIALKSFISNGQLERAGIKVEMTQWGNNTVFRVGDEE